MISRKCLTTKKLRKGLKVFLVGLVLLVICTPLLAIKSINDDWKSQQPTYNIKYQYYSSQFLGALRARVIQNGYARDGWLSSLLAKIHYKVYVSGIKKLPKGDSERVVLWHYYKFFPVSATLSCSSDEMFNEMINGFNQTAYGNFSRKYEEHIWRYDRINSYLRYFIRCHGTIQRSKEEKIKLADILMNGSLNAYQKLDPEDFKAESSRTMKAIPLRISSTLIHFISQRILSSYRTYIVNPYNFDITPYKNNKPCKSEWVKDFIEVHKKSKDILAIYKEAIFSKNFGSICESGS